ncbi:hypothetical protein RGAI101_2199 [Roseobacter sp. GAI101]|nr:hypothetical protein RGAI101_2199 [Roseobacter sp. GAI101]
MMPIGIACVAKMSAHHPLRKFSPKFVVTWNLFDSALG